VPDGLQVWLDTRPVRTPDKQILTVPPSKHQLATAIALEWDLLHSPQQALKTHYIPMTSLAARAMYIEQADAQGTSTLRDDLSMLMMRYLSTDTLICWAPDKHRYDAPQDTMSLRQLQINVATPITTYLRTHVWPGVVIRPVLEPDSIMPIPQPDLTQEVVRGWISGLPAFELAGLERAMLASKSLLVAARLVHEWGEAFAQERKAVDGRRFGIEEAAEASSLEVRWQTSQNGEVEDTHDVEREDLKRQLGSVVLLIGGDAV
jgi:ATP synthase F1 complex assembly factor 2